MSVFITAGKLGNCCFCFLCLCLSLSDTWVMSQPVSGDIILLLWLVLSPALLIDLEHQKWYGIIPFLKGEIVFPNSVPKYHHHFNLTQLFQNFLQATRLDLPSAPGKPWWWNSAVETVPPQLLPSIRCLNTLPPHSLVSGDVWWRWGKENPGCIYRAPKQQIAVLFAQLSSGLRSTKWILDPLVRSWLGHSPGCKEGAVSRGRETSVWDEQTGRERKISAAKLGRRLQLRVYVIHYLRFCKWVWRRGLIYGAWRSYISIYWFAGSSWIINIPHHVCF